MCENLSLKHICSSCQKTFLTPSLYKRKLSNNIEVISFYRYAEIKELLFTKHTDLGFYIYNILAELSFKKFAHTFEFSHRVVSLAIDDNITSGYSHTGILNKELKSHTIKPLYSRIRATNTISYSGKSKEFRLLNPRNFKVKKFQEKDVILVDDIITTGLTLLQAIEKLQRADKEVLFCLTLCDVSQE
jgi:competence protein ComFC